MTKPITPYEVVTDSLPKEVLESFNELIQETFNQRSSCFTQKAVIERMIKKGLNRESVFLRSWLDVEPLYRGVGWIVSYTYYPASFTFTPKTYIRMRKTQKSG